MVAGEHTTGMTLSHDLFLATHTSSHVEYIYRDLPRKRRHSYSSDDNAHVRKWYGHY